jgi:hypothetical protein
MAIYCLRSYTARFYIILQQIKVKKPYLEKNVRLILYLNSRLHNFHVYYLHCLMQDRQERDYLLVLQIRKSQKKEVTCPEPLRWLEPRLSVFLH